VSDDGSMSQLEYERTVQHELFPPSNESDVYRARITVKTVSSYYFRAADDQDAGGADEKKEEEKPAEEETLEDPLNPIDPSLHDPTSTESGATPAGKSGKPSLKGTATTRKDEDTRTYDLAYEGGRWVLKTQLDPATEELIDFAFDHALKRQ
jgi:hypothetical protein